MSCLPPPPSPPHKMLADQLAELAIQPGPNGRFLVHAAESSKPFVWKGDTGELALPPVEDG